MAFLVLSSFLAFFALIERSGGYPAGAGGCTGGGPAVGGPFHLRTGAVTGFLSDYGLELLLDGAALDPSTVTDFGIGVDHSLTLSATNDKPFKGFLLRLGTPTSTAVNTTGALIPGSSDSQFAFVCVSPVVGITHTDNATKASTSGTLRLDQAVDNVTLDVTVVVENNLTGSMYYYSGFTLNAVALSQPSSSRPSVAPVQTGATPVSSPSSPSGSPPSGSMATTTQPIAITKPSAPAAKPSSSAAAPSVGKPTATTMKPASKSSGALAGDHLILLVLCIFSILLL